MFSNFKYILYVQVSPETLTIRNPKTGDSISEPAELAITSGPKPKMVAAGAAARTAALDPTITLVRPFAHPRSLMSDFTAAHQLLKDFFRRMPKQSIFQASPMVVIHLQGEPAGGFTQLEFRAFRELVLGAGAARAKVWQGPNLTDQELLSDSFPATGTVSS